MQNFYSMYLIEYKFPSLPQMCLVQTSQAKNLIFLFFGTKDMSRKKSKTLGLHLGQLK